MGAGEDQPSSLSPSPQQQPHLPIYTLGGSSSNKRGRHRLLVVYIVGPLSVLLVLRGGGGEGEEEEGQQWGEEVMRAIGVEVRVSTYGMWCIVCWKGTDGTTYSHLTHR